ncbi:MAG: lipo-like protein [Rhodoferax sp.]
MKTVARWFGRRLSRYLNRQSTGRGASAAWPVDLAMLAVCLRPGDVLLVEGNTRVSAVIKYLTQSTWSHTALFVGAQAGPPGPDGMPLCLVEADMELGVHAVGLARFRGLHCRICRPVGMTPEEVQRLCDFAVQRLGEQYDLKNVVDLARYLFPTPPVPPRWRRRMLALGSGDPTRAICSTLIAQCFESVRYPILPLIETVHLQDPDHVDQVREILHVRHYSLYVPRDFDVSPYFQIIKPTLMIGFDYHALSWGESAPPASAAGTPLSP